MHTEPRRPSSIRLIATSLVLIVTACLLSRAIGKTSPPLADLLRTADSVVLGRIDTVISDNTAVANATLSPLLWLKGGTGSSASIPVRLYRTGLRDGLVALWVLKRDANGHLEETYPWMRLLPNNWFDLPDFERQQLFNIVRHVATQPVSGLSLHILLLPDRQLSAVQVFVCVSNSLATPIVIPISSRLSTSTLQIIGPAKETKISLLESHYTDNSEIAPFAVPSGQQMCLPTLLENSYQSAQITVKQQPLIGKYTVRARLEVGNHGKNGLSWGDFRRPQHAKIWHGVITARLSTTIKN